MLHKFRHYPSSELEFEPEINQYFCCHKNFAKQNKTNCKMFVSKNGHLKAKNRRFEAKFLITFLASKRFVSRN